MATEQETIFRQEAHRIRDSILELNAHFFRLRNEGMLEELKNNMFLYDTYNSFAEFCHSLPYEPSLIAKYLAAKGK